MAIAQTLKHVENVKLVGVIIITDKEDEDEGNGNSFECDNCHT